MDQTSESPTPPLHRHAALVPLSREHMSGLVQARNLRRASPLDAASRRRAIEDFTRVWDTEIRAHFDDEERLLLPLTRDPALRRRLLDEHGAIRAMAEACRASAADGADPAMMDRLGALLHDHIRWEEREYFEAVQREHPGALAELEHEAAGIEQRRPGSRARKMLTWLDGPDDKGASTMSDDRQRTPPAERFAADHLVFDLREEAAALDAEHSPTTHGHRQKTLYKRPGLTVALFVLDAGAALHEHAAAGTVTVQAIEGSLTLTVGSHTHRLAAGGLMVMAPGIRHGVRAESRAVFLLQVSLPGQARRD
ncbi:MAG: hemerythrin domain-containing protein [Phycisphaerales bacterium]|nr:hemerythrin domain-containing protein [Phycisphaerales bacterium]